MIRALAALVALALVGCAPPAPPPAVEVDASAVRVTGTELREVVVTDDSGLVLARREAPGLDRIAVAHNGAPGTAITVTVSGSSAGSVLATIPAAEPLRVRVDVPSGQGARPLDARLPFSVIGAAGTQATFIVSTDAPGAVRVVVGGVEHRVDVRVPGERAVLTVPIPADRDTPVEIADAAYTIRGLLVPERVSLDAARAQLALDAVAFPATADGAPEAARPPGRVTLPAPWWSALLRRAGLGTRGRDRRTPWSFAGVRLTNTGADDLNLVVRARVLDARGVAAPAFRPEVRRSTDGTGEVSGLLRVPAGGAATAALPVFVDDTLLDEGASTFVREVVVTPLGSDAALWEHREPLHVQRGSTWVSVGFLLALLGAVGGTGLVLRGVRRWIGDARTADLTTIAVFATLAFIVGTAAAVVAGVAGAVLGPFQTFVTNLLDDALRYALLATLVTLLPRPGVAALSLLITWLMRGVVLGGFSPVDVLFVGGQIFWLESCLWIAGLTRGDGGVDATRVRRWLRLGTGFATASLLTALSGLALSMVLYRLYYAGWYVAALLALPGFLYVWIACWWAAGFAGSLRAVER